MKNFVNIVYVGAGGLALLATLILILGNLNQAADFWFFTSVVKGHSIGLLLLYAAVTGAVMTILIKVFFKGIAGIYRNQKKDRQVERQAEKLLAEREKQNDGKGKAERKDKANQQETPAGGEEGTPTTDTSETDAPDDDDNRQAQAE